MATPSLKKKKSIFTKQIKKRVTSLSENARENAGSTVSLKLKCFKFIFNIFKYILKIIFMLIALLLIIIYICIII